ATASSIQTAGFRSFPGEWVAGKDASAEAVKDLRDERTTEQFASVLRPTITLGAIRVRPAVGRGTRNPHYRKRVPASVDLSFAIGHCLGIHRNVGHLHASSHIRLAVPF